MYRAVKSMKYRYALIFTSIIYYYLLTYPLIYSPCLIAEVPSYPVIIDTNKCEQTTCRSPRGYRQLKLNMYWTVSILVAIYVVKCSG